MTLPARANLANDSQDLPPITNPYLLILGIPCYRDQEGRRYLDLLWYKDLIEHLRYLKNFTLACPCEQIDLPKDTICVDNDPAFSNIQLVDLPPTKSLLEAIATLPVTVAKLWQAIGRADIVHTGVADWPIPKGWLVTPIVKLRQKFYLINIESAFWRLPPGRRSSIKSRIQAQVFEKVNSWCVNQADMALFTQEEYRQSLLKKQSERAHIIHASWIDEDKIISEADAKATWHKKLLASSAPIKILFAGRLLEAKGVLILLEAMKVLNKDSVSVELDILGEGELLNECETASHQVQGTVKIRLLGTVPYGWEFFRLLQNYHAIVVPSISDEQPRIVYDGYSQAIPAIASNTAGLRDCIRNGETGILVNPGDPIALADKIKWSLSNLNQLENMGMKSLKVASSMTHQTMHRKRWQLLLNVLDEFAKN